MSINRPCTAFQEKRCVAAGELIEVALKVKALVDSGNPELVLIFDDSNAQPIELDLRGSKEDVLRRLEQTYSTSDKQSQAASEQRSHAASVSQSQFASEQQSPAASESQFDCGSEQRSRAGVSDIQSSGQSGVDALEPRKPGRPKLGVVSREVTLLPRQWDWLNQQPGGASVALRKLVDQARRTNGKADAVRQSREATYRFMSGMAGNEPGFEEATRALFANNKDKFENCIETWTPDLKRFAIKLAATAFTP